MFFILLLKYFNSILIFGIHSASFRQIFIKHGHFILQPPPPVLPHPAAAVPHFQPLA